MKPARSKNTHELRLRGTIYDLKDALRRVIEAYQDQCAMNPEPWVDDLRRLL